MGTRFLKKKSLFSWHPAQSMLNCLQLSVGYMVKCRTFRQAPTEASSNVSCFCFLVPSQKENIQHGPQEQPAHSCPGSQAGLAPLTAGRNWRASCVRSAVPPRLARLAPKKRIRLRKGRARSMLPGTQVLGQTARFRSAEAWRPFYAGPPSRPLAQSAGGVFESRREASAPPPQ